jgi:NADPH2:quinone reductase
MLAVIAETFGPPDVLRISEVPDPEPGPGEVLIEVVAAGVNPVDAGNRADGTWAGISAPVIVGSDVAGIIRELGTDVPFRRGDRVFAMVDFLGRQSGTYAQLVAVPADLIVRIPRGVDFVTAAAVPLAAGTAFECIRRLHIKRGERVAILGAAGGVGSFAVQLARNVGATVVAVASERHWPLLRELGARGFVDHRRRVADGILSQYPTGLDAVIDLVGDGALSRVLPAVRPTGRLATTVTFHGDLELAVDRNMTLHGVLVRPDGRRLRALARLLATGRLRAIVDQVLPWEAAAEAHSRLETGHGRGKIVLLVGSGHAPA